LEHVPDPDRALAELVRVTKPGGWLFLVVPVEAQARRQYAHNCEFPDAKSLIDLVSKDDRLDANTIKTDVAPYSGEKPEIRLVVRKHGAPARREPRPRREAPAAKVEEQPGSEARFDSRKNPDCKDASLWTSYDGSAEVEVAEMLGGLIRGLQPDCVVETGSSHGRTSQVLGAALRANGHGQLFSLENDIHLMRQARRRCRGLPVQCVHTDSLQWEPPNDAEIDFAFFDSRHKIRVPEFHHLRAHMTTRTIVAFHDTSPRKGTRAPVEQLAEEGWIAPVFLPTPRGIVIARVLK
jgi:predicted O-methyltransferase YrrM